MSQHPFMHAHYYSCDGQWHPSTRLIGALLAEQHETWRGGRCYLDMEPHWKQTQVAPTLETLESVAHYFISMRLRSLRYNLECLRSL